MAKFVRGILVIVLLAVFAGAAGLAQQQGGGQWSQVREKYKYTFQLMQMVSHIDAIDKDAKHALTKDQAKKTLAVLQPLRSKPKLTQDQAKQALKGLKPIFTTAQLNAMAKIKPARRTGQRPPAEGRPGGARATRPHRDPNAMQDFNPFYTNVDPKDKFATERVKRWNEFFTRLDKKANPPKNAQTKSEAPKKPSSSSAGKTGSSK